MQRAIQIVVRSPEETRILGAALAPTLLPGDVISLSGDLGAGKTVFVQGLGAALGVQERITSPSFTIVHEYEGRYPIVHLDVYRLGSFQEVIDLGFEEFLGPQAILMLEWGDAVEPLLPRSHLRVEIVRASIDDPEERTVIFRPRGDEYVRKIFDMMHVAETLLDAVAADMTVASRFEQVVAPDEPPRRRTSGGEE